MVKDLAMDGVSIIICTFNGEKRINKTLQSIVNQKANFFWELILINNASSDQTKVIASDFLVKNAVNISWKIVDENRQGLVYARLAGLKASMYNVLLFCDDDNFLFDDYLQLGGELMKKNFKIGALGGLGIADFEVSKPSWFDKYSHSFAVGPQNEFDGKINKKSAELYGAGIFLRKEPLINYFDYGFELVLTGRSGKHLISGDDIEWCSLIQLAGYEIWYDHRLKFYHFMPSSRMKWNYYIKLKKGIVSGSALLLPYKCLLVNPELSIYKFKQIYLFNTLKVTFIFFKNLFFLNLFSVEFKLTISILYTRMKVYWKDWNRSVMHFKQLKSFQ